jgi:hypothetical protein
MADDFDPSTARPVGGPDFQFDPSTAKPVEDTGFQFDPSTARPVPETTLFRENLYKAVRTNPDSFAEAKRLSDSMGLPVNVLYRNLEDARQKAGFQSLAKLAETRPFFAKAFENHDFAMLAHDDTENLSALEQGVRYLGNAGRAVASGLPMAAAGFWRGEQAVAETLAPLAEPLVGTILPENPFRRIAAGAAETGRGEQQRAADWMPDGGGVVEQGIYSGLQSLGSNMLTVPMALATGNPAYMLAPMAAQTGGLEYGKARDAGLSVPRAQVYGLGQGAIEAGTEMLPAFRFLRDIKAGSGFWKTLGAQLLTEIPGEQAATALQDLNEWAALHPEKTFQDYLQARPDAALQTLIATAVGTGSQTAIFSGLDAAGRKLSGADNRAAAAEHDASALGDFLRLVEDSKVRERSPTSLAEFLTQAAQHGGAPTDLYFDARQFAQSIQEAGGDVAALAQAMPSLAEQIGPALAAGTDIRLPVGEFAAGIAGTGYESALVDHARMAEDGLSAFESREAIQEQQATLERMAEEMGAVVPQGVQAVEDDITGQLRAVGFEPSTAEAYAKLYTSGVATLAERAGVDPQALHEQYGLTVTRPMPDVLRQVGTSDVRLDPLLDRLRRGDRPTQLEMWGPSLIDALRAAGGIIDDGGELANRDIDKGLKPFARKMIKADGMTLDHAAEWAQERGYIQDRNPDELLAAIDDELQGNPHFAPNAGDPAKADLGRTLDQLDEYLQRLGVDIHQADNAEIRKVLDEAARQEAAIDKQGVEFGQEDLGKTTGQRPGLFSLPPVPVTVLSGEEFGAGLSKKQLAKAADDLLRQWQKEGRHLKNEDTDWNLAIGKKDRQKMGDNADLTAADSKAVAKLDEIVNQAVLAETHADYEHNNASVTAIHRLYAPAEIAGRLYRIKLTVKDYSEAFGRRNLHALESVEIEDAPPGTLPAADDGESPATRAQPTTGRTISISHLLGGATRNGDGLPFAEDGTIYRQELAEKKRGYIRFGKARKFQIGLLEKADLSTFLHETGHFWLEVMGDLAEQEGASQQIRDDYATLLRWFGVENRGQIEVKHHEQFARGNEAYLMEGKAPSAELRGVFQRFRAWLTMVYRTLRGLNVNLTRDVRAVFDRIYATDAAIEAAKRETDVAALFLTPEDAGMSEAQFEAYRGAVGEASEKARDELQLELMKAYRREQAGWYKERKAEVRAEVEKEVDAQPVYQAFAALTAKPEDGQPAIRLSRDELAKRYGAEYLKRLPRSFGRVYSATGGLPVDAVAQMYGYREGDDLVEALANMRPRKALVEAETNVRMRERYGEADPLTDGGLSSEALAAVHNDKRAEVLQVELAALRKKAREVRPFVRAAVADAVAPLKRQMADQQAAARDKISGLQDQLSHQKRERAYERRWYDAERNAQQEADRAGRRMLAAQDIPLSAFRDAARGRIGQMRVRDIRPTQFLSAGRKAARDAMTAATKNDWLVAAEAKQREILNHYLYKEAMRAQKDADSIYRTMKSYTETKARERLGKAGADYLEQMDALTDRYEFRRISGKAMDRRESLAAFAARMEEQGTPMDLPPGLLDEARRMNYRSVSVDELRAVRDAAEMISHLARLKNKLLADQKKRELAEAVAEAVASIDHNFRGERRAEIETRLPAANVRHVVSSFFASHRKMASILREMDGFQDGGTLWELLMKPANEAAAREASVSAEAGKRLWDLLRPYRKITDLAKPPGISYLTEKLHVPAIGRSLSRQARLAVALNWGNLDSRQKIMDGYGWSEGQVQAILDTLSKEDWDFVQGVWDYLNSYWPDIAAKQKRVTGLEPEKVQAAEVITRHGTYRGGYYPMAYDDRQSVRAYADRAAEAAKAAMSGGYTRATTSRGHTKARVEGVKRPVRLDLGVIPEHVEKVIHDLTHHEYLVDANRLLGSKDLQSAILGTYGPEIYRQLQDGLTDIAGGNVPAVQAFDIAINHVRQGATIAGLGYNLMTSLMQPLGLTQSMVRIGPKWVGRGLSRWLTGAARMEDTAAWIYDRSETMRNRAATMQREINEIRNSLGGKGQIGGALEDSYFWLIGKAQQMVDIPTWLGAYEKAMGEGREEGEAAALADQAVLDSQGGGQVKDLAAVQRGGPTMKLFTNFYSFFNTTYNLAAERTKQTDFRDPASVAKLAGDYLLLYTVPVVLSMALKEALRGSDDGDDWPEKLAKEQLSYLMGSIVGLRDLGAAVQGFDYAGPAGLRFFSEFAKLGKQAMQGEADGAFLRALNATAGILFHYPAGAVQRAVDGYAAWQDGEAGPGAMLFGPPLKR